MCRTAIIDMGLEGAIDITRCDLPSRTLAAIPCAVPVMVNHGKSAESGLAFGDIVAGRAKRTAVQVERASGQDGVIVLWELEPNEVASGVALALSGHFNLPMKSLRPSRAEEGGRHTIRCTCPGEPLFVNGTFVGVVDGPDVRVHLEGGRITRMEGVKAKGEGLAKLDGIKEAMFKSGYIRHRAAPAHLRPVRYGRGSIAVIDHAAFGSLDSIGAETVCALTIGDDTTEVAGDVLARLGIRVIGITDGDLDHILAGPQKAEGSVVFKVRGTTDDGAGAALARAISGADTFEGFVQKVKDELGRMGVAYEVSR